MKSTDGTANKTLIAVNGQKEKQDHIYKSIQAMPRCHFGLVFVHSTPVGTEPKTFWRQWKKAVLMKDSKAVLDQSLSFIQNEWWKRNIWLTEPGLQELIDSKLDEFGRKNLIHPTVVNQLKIFFFHIHFYNPYLHDFARAARLHLRPELTESFPAFFNAHSERFLSRRED